MSGRMNLIISLGDEQINAHQNREQIECSYDHIIMFINVHMNILFVH